MNDDLHTRPKILVTGTSRPFDGVALQAARMVGDTLADHGFDLTTGNATGVDREVARAFCARLEPHEIYTRYEQLALGFFRRGGFWPGPTFKAGLSKTRLTSTEDWLNVATRCDAVIMVGGHGGRKRSKLAGGGAWRIVKRFIELGKPVFPIPFSGGRSNEIFEEVLAHWTEGSIPNLSRMQFLRLAEPWWSGTGALADLLHGTLAKRPDIFISYRREDTGWLCGRLHDDLSLEFGTKRVFMDSDDLRVGTTWTKQLDHAMKYCRVGIVVVGNRWVGPTSKGERINEPDDTVHKEVRRLLEKSLIVLLADRPPLSTVEIPPGLVELARLQAIPITNATWRAIVDQLIVTIRAMLAEQRREQTKRPTRTIGGTGDGAATAVPLSHFDGHG